MKVPPLSLHFSVMPIIGLSIIALCMVALAARSDSVHAAPTTDCRVVLALDNSASVGATNWNTYRNQIYSLFSSPSLINSVPNLKLAFWTFSHDDNGNANFNPRSHEYVSAFGPDSGFGPFRADLAASPLDGAYTNYAQAFAYNPNRNGDTNTFSLQLNGNLSIRRIAHGPDGDPDVIAMLTDGAPNHPGTINPARPQDGEYFGDGNQAALDAAYQARQLYPGTNFIAGFINPDDNGDARRLLTQSINGPSGDPNANNVGPIQINDPDSGNESLSGFLERTIPEQCNVQTIDWSLAPNVTPKQTVISSGTLPRFDYNVTNTSTDDADGTSSWQIYDVTINPGVAGNPLSCGTNSYCNNVTGCAEILQRFGGNGTCGLSKDGNNSGNSAENAPFTIHPSLTQLYNDREASVSDIDDLPLGTQVCRLLQLKRPTGNGSAVNRTYGACSFIGKTPLVQIHGGDLRVGSRFNGDTTAYMSDSGVYTSKFKISKNANTVPNGRTYGSWTEYGVLARGPIRSMASLSGYGGGNGGYDQAIFTDKCDLGVNRLTFANTINDPSHPEQNKECGHMTDTITIPDVVSALTSRTALNPSSYAVPLKFDSNSSTGLYQSSGTNVEITASTISKGKTHIVYIPNGTVTISGNINYVDDPTDKYKDVTDIPQLIIIAKDIKINVGVVRVDAWLVATGGGSSGGTIDTCAGYTGALSSTTCNSQLVINGPVMARELDLLRTKVYDQDEACVIESIGDCKTVGEPAEVITLPGSSILWSQNFELNPARARTSNTTELPPYF